MFDCPGGASLGVDVAAPAFVMVVVPWWCGPDYTEVTVCLPRESLGAFSSDVSAKHGYGD